MLFSSPLFIFIFLPIVLLGYGLSGEKLRNLWLLIASLFFYAWGEPKLFLLLLLSVTINFYIGLAIECFRKQAKLFVILAVIYNIGMLVYFKYSAFFVENINTVFSLQIPVPKTYLPLGISFYTFQILSYVIDVYRGKTDVQKNILHLGLYLTLFPQLIAGPIVRYSDVSAEISHRQTTKEDLRIGTVRFITGFAKKVLLADSLALIADRIFSNGPESMVSAWIGIIAFTLQIYYDFIGYSDMAIGMGRFFGFHFLENFDYPYISESVREYWRRWHISLGSWFREYVYIPLGGNRKGLFKTYRNLMIVFFLTGLWHGASWNYILWGVFHGIFIIAERVGGSKILEKIPRVFRHIYAAFVIIFGFVLFRTSSLQEAAGYYRFMFDFSNIFDNSAYLVLSTENIFILICGTVFLIPRICKLFTEKMSAVKYCLLFIVFIAALACMLGRGYNPFIYFRF